MAIPGNEVENVLREWAPLTDLFQKLPAKAQNGLFNQDVKLTCVDILSEFLALGTNLGIVYWYNRKKKDLQRLRCENANSPITVVKVISTVDYMVACGNKDGSISIFQIPKSHPESLPESLKPKNKQVERYTVSELHKAAISAIEWSKNGMKLFSGDKNGLVVLTEIDFYMHLCKSVEILNETYEVVQLSYYQQNLLISTTYRSIICQKLDKWKISQVGKKDRKVLGNFGGIFYQNGLRPSDTVLYCTRPGLRIWISDLQGSVQQTLLFKDLLSHECAEVQIINPISNNVKQLKAQKEASFGVLLPFNDDLIVTYSNDIVYVLDPKETSVLFTISSLRGVLGVATHKDEIFILEGERSLLRLSYHPEPSYEITPSIPTATNFLPISSSIRDLTKKLQTTSIISAIPPLLENSINLNIHTDVTSIINAEEATESPKKNRKYEANPATFIDTEKKLEIYDKIGQQEFDDDILFKQHKNRKKHNKMNISSTSLSSNSSEDKDISCTRPTLMNLSTVGILPDFRSPDTILSDIQYKEKMLADILNFDKVKVGDSGETKTAENSTIDENDFVNNLDTLSTSTIKNDDEDEDEETQQINNTEFHIKPFKSIAPEFNGLKPKKYLPVAYGPPSGSSNPNSLGDTTPACVNIPMDWKLAEVHLNAEKNDSSLSDTSLADWEII